MLNRDKRFLKRLDRMVGPWLCKHVNPRVAPAGVGADLRRRATNGPFMSANSPKRILVVRPGGLGDAVLTFPLIKHLRDFFGDAQIDVLAETRNAGVYGLNPFVQRIYLYDSRPIATFLRLQRAGYDMVVDTEQFHHLSAIMANALQPTYLCGFASLSRSRLLTHAVPYEENVYEVFSFLGMAEALSGRMVTFDPNAPFVDIPMELQEWANAVLDSMGDRAIVTVVPSAGAQNRVWPAERFAEVVQWLAQKCFFILLLGGKDASRAAKTISAGLGRNAVHNMASLTTLPQAAALIKRARVHLSSDTGILHLAYGVGTSTVSLFGPGNHNKWAPRGDRHVVVRAGLPCSPCTQHGISPRCPHGAACISEISVDAVKKALTEVLDR
jgi:ADP-heptose:LPS heptosyltransferase